MPRQAQSPALVPLGRVLGAHGVRGFVRVRWHGDGPQNMLAAETLTLAASADGRCGCAYPVEQSAAGRAQEVRLKLQGVATREAAQALAGQWVLAEAAALQPLPQGEYYWRDLIGCRAQTAGGRALGTVRGLLETGAHDVLVIRDAAGRETLAPTARPFLTHVDLPARSLTMAEHPGLLLPADA